MLLEEKLHFSFKKLKTIVIWRGCPSPAKRKTNLEESQAVDFKVSHVFVFVFFNFVMSVDSSDF